MSETLCSLSVSYPSLGQLRSAAWRTIKRHMESQTEQQQSFNVEEKRYVRDLWSSESALRQLISKNHLPLELADDLEERKISVLADIPGETFRELKRW